MWTLYSTLYDGHFTVGFPSRFGVFGLCSSSGNLETKKNTTFRKLYLFPSSVEDWETPTLLGPLERANLSHWITYVNISIYIPEVRHCHCMHCAYFITIFIERFPVLTICMKTSFFWELKSCSPLKVNPWFGGKRRLHLQGWRTNHRKKPAWSRQQVEQISADFQLATCRYIPEDRNLHNYRCENLKSYNYLHVYTYSFYLVVQFIVTVNCLISEQNKYYYCYYYIVIIIITTFIHIHEVILVSRCSGCYIFKTMLQYLSTSGKSSG
jgi:hypothetical protein